jgi:hypothetical protein
MVLVNVGFAGLVLSKTPVLASPCKYVFSAREAGFFSAGAGAGDVGMLGGVEIGDGEFEFIFVMVIVPFVCGHNVYSFVAFLS